MIRYKNKLNLFSNSNFNLIEDHEKKNSFHIKGYSPIKKRCFTKTTIKLGPDPFFSSQIVIKGKVKLAVISLGATVVLYSMTTGDLPVLVDSISPMFGNKTPGNISPGYNLLDKLLTMNSKDISPELKELFIEKQFSIEDQSFIDKDIAKAMDIDKTFNTEILDDNKKGLDLLEDLKEDEF